MALFRLFVLVLAMTSLFVNCQVTSDISVTTAQLAPSLTTAASGTADSLTTAAAAVMTSAAMTSATTTIASSTMDQASSTLSASAASSTMSSSAAASTNPVQTSSTVVSSRTTSSQSSTGKAAASADGLPTSFAFNDPTYARTVAAVVGGCGLFILNTIFFIVVSLMLRYTLRMERHRMPKVPRKSLTGGGGLFYGGNEVQSNQALFAPSLSATNIVGGSSDIQLDARGGGRGVYHNRAFNSEATGSSQATISADDGYKPIEIKSQGGATSRA